ncbi:MAG: hypothetical protein RR054_04470 [Clostridia bacterium]
MTIKNTYHWRVIVCGNSVVNVGGNGVIEACANSRIYAYDSSLVIAENSSYVEARGNSKILAKNESCVWASDNCLIEAMDNCLVRIMDNVTVEARGNAQIIVRGNNEKVKLFGNARIIYDYRNIIEFMDFYNIRHTKTKGSFYIAVYKDKNNHFYNDYNKNFEYIIGNTYEEECSKDIDDYEGWDFEEGLEISCLDRALGIIQKSKDFVILEVKTNIKDVIMPRYMFRQAITSALKVIREVSLDECGLYGEILSKRLSKK